MDRQDKEFQTFLRQFQLRKPGPFLEVHGDRPRPSRNHPVRWMAAAAAVVLVILLSAGIYRNYMSSRGPHATVEMAGSKSLYKIGQRIDPGEVVRSNDAEGVVLALEDGSHIEMRSQSALALESAADGVRIRLNSGGIIVNAARQRAGHLYVRTRDLTVSVVGTVFYVNAEQTGSQVAVVEGEVQVQQGGTLKKLLPGEQVASDSTDSVQTVAERIGWSRNAGPYLVLLEQSTGAVIEHIVSQAQNGEHDNLPEVGQQPVQHSDTKIQMLMDTSEKLAAEGRYSDSARILQLVLNVDRNRSLASFRLAEIQFQQGDFNGALQLFRDSLGGDLNPQWIEALAHLYIGKIYDIRDQRVRASEEYRRVIVIGDNFNGVRDEARKYLATPFRQAGNPPEQQQNPSSAPRGGTPENSGKNIFNRACTTCHSSEPTARTNFSTKAEYASLVSREIAKGTEVSAAEIPVLVDYLWENFGKIPADTPARIGIK